MKKILVVTDYQNDFINGSLGFEGADAICTGIIRKIEEYRISGGEVLFTYDTHTADYLATAEGRNLPVEHCIRDTQGWQLSLEVQNAKLDTDKCIFKPSFGSAELLDYLREGKYELVEFVGLVTNICIISNAIIAKTALPEARVIVDASCVDSFDKSLHEKSLDVMQGLQIEVTGR